MPATSPLTATHRPDHYGGSARVVALMDSPGIVVPHTGAALLYDSWNLYCAFDKWGVELSELTASGEAVALLLSELHARYPAIDVGYLSHHKVRRARRGEPGERGALRVWGVFVCSWARQTPAPLRAPLRWPGASTSSL